MGGVWKIDIKHFRTYRCRTGIALGVIMSDEDEQKGVLPLAIEKAVIAIKKELNKKEHKNVKSNGNDTKNG